MRAALRPIGGFVSAVSAAALATTVVTSAMNPALSWTDVAAAGVALIAAFFLLLVVPVALCWLGAGRIRQSAGDMWLFTLVSLFALLWFARLEPAHQVLSVRPHISRIGSVELVLLAGWSAIALAAIRFSTRASIRWLATLAVLAAAHLSVAAVARAVEPFRQRDAVVAGLASRFPAQPGAQARSHRVLVIGIDGLEWRALAWMIDHGRMPAFQQLLRTGRFYQHDNRAIGYSAAIWTSIYTGRPQRETGIDDFAKWQFAWAQQAVRFLPRFGMHAVFFLDELMRRIDLQPLWRVLPVTSADCAMPPVWSIASHRGRRVAVYDPEPQIVVPERLNGVFAVTTDAGHELFWDGAAAPDVIGPPGHAGDAFDDERASAATAASLFRRARADLGVYYTHFVDSVQHEDWDFRLRGFLGGDPQPALDERFDATRIRQAYDTADAVIAQLVEAFGQDATVVVVSDHGFRYDDYEHFRSPFGVLTISPMPQTGYGGVADILAIAPSILALLGVPADPTMADAVAPLAVERTTEQYVRTVRRQFLEQIGPDSDRLDRLRSLGYVEGRSRPKQR